MRSLYSDTCVLSRDSAHRVRGFAFSHSSSPVFPYNLLFHFFTFILVESTKYGARSAHNSVFPSGPNQRTRRRALRTARKIPLNYRCGSGRMLLHRSGKSVERGRCAVVVGVQVYMHGRPRASPRVGVCLARRKCSATVCTRCYRYRALSECNDVSGTRDRTAQEGRVAAF